jgi:hypothetical protein
MRAEGQSEFENNLSIVLGLAIEYPRSGCCPVAGGFAKTGNKDETQVLNILGPVRSLADLTAAGVLTEPVSAMPEFLHGSTALDLSKKSMDRSPTDVSDFSVRDRQIWVYSMSEQNVKLSKGMVAARIYDQQNRLRVNVPAKKVSLSSSPARLAFGFPPTAVGPGTARIDVTWDDRPVWRTFVHIME